MPKLACEALYLPYLAVFLGYPVDPIRLEVAIIDPAHYRRRKRQLGPLDFFIDLVLLVRRLAEQGIIRGQALILDSSKLPCCYHPDPDARWNGFLKINGYKIHLGLDHLSLPPLMFAVTPANVSDSVPAILLLLAVKMLYGFAVQVVRADTAHWTAIILRFILSWTKARPGIDYNLCRMGKKSIASLGFLHWRRGQ